MPLERKNMDKKKKAKKDNPSTAKDTTQARGNKPAPVVADADDLSHIFSALTQKKHKAGPHDATEVPPAHLAQRAAVAAAARDARPPRDGLYHAPEKDMHMTDLGFFGGTVRGGRKVHTTAPAAGSGAQGGDDDTHEEETLEVSEALLKQERVDRIVTMSQLRKMLSRNPNAGSTPNCPFDCDCCF